MVKSKGKGKEIDREKQREEKGERGMLIDRDINQKRNNKR